MFNHPFHDKIPPDDIEESEPLDDFFVSVFIGKCSSLIFQDAEP